MDLEFSWEIIYMDFRTSLFPKGEGYLLPIKVAVRRAEHLEFGDTVTVRVHLDV